MESLSKIHDNFAFLAIIKLQLDCKFITFLFIRHSPYETEELDLSDEKGDDVKLIDGGETPFASFHHCLWFTIASWVQQGCDFLPRLEKILIFSILPNTIL